MRKVLITDTILRDAHQSQAATRMRLDEMLPVLDQLDEIRLYIGEDCDINVSASHFASTSVLNLMSYDPINSDKNYHVVAKLTGGSFGFVNPHLFFDHKIGENKT